MPHTQWPEFHSLPEAFIVKQAKPFPLQNMELNFAPLFHHFCLIGAADTGKQIYSGEYLNTWHTFWCKHPCCQIKSFSYLQKSNHLKLKRFDLEKPINVLSIIINCKHHRCLANRSDSREYWNTWDNFVPLLELDWKIENNQSYDKKRLKTPVLYFRGRQSLQVSTIDYTLQ